MLQSIRWDVKAQVMTNVKQNPLLQVDFAPICSEIAVFVEFFFFSELVSGFVLESL